MQGMLVMLCTILVLSVSTVSTVEAQGREHERERFHTEHWVYDNRFHHNHYYPVLGYRVAVLPPGFVTLRYRGVPYWYEAGVWYVAGPGGYVVARPPIGIVIPVLPPGYTVVSVAGVPYYYANDIYYVQQPGGGYAVAESPAVATVSPTPPPAVAAPPVGATAPSAPGTWYYCESSKTYYPYVAECKEGWRPVPSTPPGVPR